MNRNGGNEELKYLALAEAAMGAVAGLPIEKTAQKGLDAAVEYIDLAAGALILWDESGEVSARAVSATSEADRQSLMDMESSMLKTLRQDYRVNTAYMELSGEPVRSVFSLPIESSGRQYGALIGIKDGKAQLHIYDHFLRALAAVFSLASMPVTGPEGISSQEVGAKLKAEREAAIVEIAVAINHEINNPLTALLGNLQLLMLKNRDLPEDIQERLKVIEESANQIREVTGRLMKAADAPSVDYTGGMKMIDLSGKSKKKNAENKAKEKEGD